MAAKVAYILCRSISVKPTIEEALFYYSLDRVDEDKLTEIRNHMSLNALKINPSFLSLNFGIKYGH